MLVLDDFTVIRYESVPQGEYIYKVFIKLENFLCEC